MKYTQTEKLIQHLRQGKPINFLEAYYSLGIQDLRKRLMEVREAGYRIRKRKERDIKTGVEIHGWSLDVPLFRGDFVRITAAPVLPNGTHPLFGREGVILSVDEDNKYTVGDIKARKAFGRFLHRDLMKIAKYSCETWATFRAGEFEIVGYDSDTRNYILREGSTLFYAPGHMLTVNQVDRTVARGFIPC